MIDFYVFSFDINEIPRSPSATKLKRDWNIQSTNIRITQIHIFDNNSK